jgi:hypothetical protein
MLIEHVQGPSSAKEDIIYYVGQSKVKPVIFYAV